ARHARAIRQTVVGDEGGTGIARAARGAQRVTYAVNAADIAMSYGGEPLQRGTLERPDGVELVGFPAALARFVHGSDGGHRAKAERVGSLDLRAARRGLRGA